ncbi:hypothetical protein [Devosia sp. DBB001]|nr:hypothetical protein [Devosia sp. DBB001]
MPDAGPQSRKGPPKTAEQGFWRPGCGFGVSLVRLEMVVGCSHRRLIAP